MTKSFSDLTKQVHMLNDLILSDMVYEAEDDLEEASSFSRHLLATKNWFSRISWSNKKRYVLALLEDVRSAWTLSLLLKSLWNCRPKDAVLSISQKHLWSSYDQVPMDHNRTALPTHVLAQVMKSDRIWFLSLEPEAQAMVLSELLIVSGGPVMWAVLSRAQVLYERYRENQLHNLQECVVVTDQPHTATVSEKPSVQPSRKLTLAVKGTASTTEVEKPDPAQAQRELEANLAAWNASIKTIKDSLKLEELEMRFIDGTSRKVWKVNRPKPEVIETVDFLQLLPSAIGKLILSYLPLNQLPEYARINKYWSFLVDDYKAELATRQKIKLDFEKLHDNMLRHDTSLEQIDPIDPLIGRLSCSQGNASTALSLRQKPPASMRPSEKSGGLYSMRHFINEKLTKPSLLLKHVGYTLKSVDYRYQAGEALYATANILLHFLHQVNVPLRKLSELSERLDQRGAADDNLWAWCEHVLKRANKAGKSDHDGVLTLGNVHFPCPLMKQCLEMPLNPPLHKDPAVIAPVKLRRNISSGTVMIPPKEKNAKRYSLWTKDFSGLYPVLKIPSYQSPV